MWRGLKWLKRILPPPPANKHFPKKTELNGLRSTHPAMAVMNSLAQAMDSSYYPQQP
jgi:hypothetical protein